MSNRAGWHYLGSGQAESDYRSFVGAVGKARHAYNREYLQEIAAAGHDGHGAEGAQKPAPGSQQQ